ncbi:HtaA domain-containing protein [Microbacterium radiodurans]|uniref:Htaa domain-containing protein n=1 Tax=Microbacterium radiodurans TaxID=661398 RepID=A0A5J5IWQ6_9MICO|nr:HtaA domain-containing protein [Microbacterium radiodurans]KAA9089716.1 hypothetical protein F6B42_04435 [Microbacterium radiodurans]
MTALLWAIKASLLDYVRGMPDGRVDLAGGAREESSGAFSFPAAPSSQADAADLRFSGSVTLTGHSGMMRVVIADPHLARIGDGWALTIDDGTGERLHFADVAGLDDRADGSRVGRSTLLTADGAELFFGPYRAGTALDDPIVTRAEPRRAG